MNTTNQEVLQQLQEHAQRHFKAIMENHATEPEKPAATPRKEPRRTVRVLPVYPPEHIMQIVPRNANCSTVNHIRGTGKMVIGPPGFSPPIRGDCTTGTNHQTTDFKPP